MSWGQHRAASSSSSSFALPALSSTLLVVIVIALAAIPDRCAAATTTTTTNVRRRANITATDHHHQPHTRQAPVPAYISLDQLAELHSQHQRLLEALEGRLERFERNNAERTSTLDEQIRQILYQQSRMDRTAVDNTRLLHDMRAEVGQHQPPPEASSSPSVTEKLESIAYLLQSLRRSIHGLNVTLDTSVRRLTSHLSKSQPAGQITSVHTAALDALADSLAPIGCENVEHRNRSFVHRIRASAVADESFYAQCVVADTRDAEPWTVVLSRSAEEANFNRNWAEYRNGFGNVAGDHWIGLQRLSEITAARLHELRVEMEDFDGNAMFAAYELFAIGNERQHYALNVLGEYVGTAGDSLSYHAGQKFSTFDADNDAWSEGNCAQAHSGGWWYKACDKSNLGGQYLGDNVSALQHNQGIYWDTFHGPSYSLKRARMMIRAL